MKDFLCQGFGLLVFPLTFALGYCIRRMAQMKHIIDGEFK
jgi:hypothetical protein